MFSTTAANFPKSIQKKRHHFTVRNSDSICIIELIQNPDDIDKDASRSLLVESFIGEYQQYLSPNEIDKNLNSWRGNDRSVQKYYEDCFHVEFTDFSKGDLHYWVKATINETLVGWVTFQHEKLEQNSVYMNLLAVHPDYQHRGIGEQLVMSLKNLGGIEVLHAVHLLLHKKNQGGRKFYSKLGFYSDSEYQREDNFVDNDLLEGMTWKNPSLQKKNTQLIKKSYISKFSLFSQLDASLNGLGNDLTPLQKSILKGFVGFAEPRKP